MTIIPKAEVERLATQAAQRGTSLDDSCPYPWGTDAAHHFKAVYLLALPRQAQGAAAGEEATA